MNHLKQRIVTGLAVAAMMTGGAAFTGASPVNAQTSEICPANDSGKIDTTGNPQTVTYTAPEGKLVSGYCVKAGTTTENITVNPPQKTVTIDHSGKDSVSHYSVILVNATSTTTTAAPTTTIAPTTTVEGDTTGEGDTPADGDTPTAPVDGDTPVVPAQPDATPNDGVVEGDGGDVAPTDDTGTNPDGTDGGNIPADGVTGTPGAPAPTPNNPVVAGDGGPAPTGSTTGTPTGTLPNTGAETNAIMAIGALLLALGGAAFAVARRRNPLTAA